MRNWMKYCVIWELYALHSNKDETLGKYQLHGVARGQKSAQCADGGVAVPLQGLNLGPNVALPHDMQQALFAVAMSHLPHWNSVP